MATTVPVVKYLKKIKKIKCLWRRIGDHMSRRHFAFPFGDVFSLRLFVATGDQPTPRYFSIAMSIVICSVVALVTRLWKSIEGSFICFISRTSRQVVFGDMKIDGNPMEYKICIVSFIFGLVYVKLDYDLNRCY